MQTIKLKNFGTSLNARPFADDIFKPIELTEDKDFILDFEGVDSASASFCHEMLSILLEEKNGGIQIKNANENILFQVKKALLVIGKNKNMNSAA
jgi:hypothetical protein